MVITEMDKSIGSSTETPGSVGTMTDLRVKAPLVHETPLGSSIARDLGQMSPVASVGRIKSNPVCLSDDLKLESMSSDDLSKLCFPPDVRVAEWDHDAVPASTAATDCSSGSSTSSRESGHESDLRSSKHLHAKVLSQETSRQGRLSQRWVTDAATGQLIRLVTGCVPILRNGNVLFVTASRKPEWILPKGGWEIDETMQESATRETYEEAGLLGVLGPRLSEIQYETRKAKKRRLEMEELLMKQKQIRTEDGASPGNADIALSSEDEHHEKTSADPRVETVTPTSPRPALPLGDPAVQNADSMNWPQLTLSESEVNRIRAEKSLATDETGSVASDSSTHYSLVRMTLFPLYVTEVRDSWPESGRCRKAVSLDEAIDMMESRPEFQKALLQVKEKGLHKLKLATAIAHPTDGQ